MHTFRDDFVAATPDNVREANRYLDALDASGSTNIEGALREAMRPAVVRGRLPLILFVTDGEPTVGDTRPTISRRSPPMPTRTPTSPAGSSRSGWGQM